MNRLLKSTKRASPLSSKDKRSILRDREKEIWDIIDLQRTAIAGLYSENRDYNRKVFEQSEKIEAITLLDDIKTIKNKLKKEVENIQETVRKKQEQDKRQMEELARQINLLNLELKKAKTKGMIDSLTRRTIGELSMVLCAGWWTKTAIKRAPFSLLITRY